MSVLMLERRRVTMQAYLYIAIGAVVGAIARYGVALWAAGLSVHPLRMPIGTLIVNVLGSFALGYLARSLTAAEPAVMLSLTVGFCGSFTTMSTLSYEFVSLMMHGEYQSAMLTMLLNVTLSAAACFAGIRLALRFG